MKWKLLLLIVGLSLTGSESLAGYFEVGMSYNYRQNFVDENNSTIQTSVTGSVSYYFWEQSAIELSYTDGTSTITLDTVDVDVKFQFYGADLVLSFAGRDATFRPYVKVGGVYQVKTTRTRISSIDRTVDFEGVAPSAGVGFRVKLTQNFVFRSGLDLWATPINDQTQFDMVGRAGVSWLF